MLGSMCPSQWRPLSQTGDGDAEGSGGLQDGDDGLGRQGSWNVKDMFAVNEQKCAGCIMIMVSGYPETVQIPEII